MNAECVFALAPGVGCSRLGAELVLLDPTGQTLRGINAEGARVLSLLDGRRTLAEVSALCGGAREVSEFLQTLLDRGLVSTAASAVTPAAPAIAGVLPAPAAIVWEQRFVGLQATSDQCMKDPPPGFCP
jgi:hypothetical protein